MEPAVKLAADSFGTRPTLLIATPLTIAGEKLARLVGRLECETWSLPLPRLVEFAQDLEFDSPAVRAYLQGELAKFELERLGSLVLGCTHFNYFKDVLREILPSHVRIIDGIDGTLNRLASELGGRLKLAGGEDYSELVGKFDAKADGKNSGKIYYPNGNSVEYFYSGRALDAAQLRKVEIFLNRLDAMREIG